MKHQYQERENIIKLLAFNGKKLKLIQQINKCKFLQLTKVHLQCVFWGFVLAEDDDGVVVEQLLGPGHDGVCLRTDKSELKIVAGTAAIVELHSCDVVGKNRLLITCTLVSVKGDTRPLL